MKEKLTIKPAQFCGSELLAIKDEKGGVHAVLNPILRGLGFNDRQIEYQRNKWLSDKVISKGVQKSSYPSQTRGIQDTYCITLKKLPFALSKIEVTPAMERSAPQLAATLEQYQEEWCGRPCRRVPALRTAQGLPAQIHQRRRSRKPALRCRPAHVGAAKPRL